MLLCCVKSILTTTTMMTMMIMMIMRSRMIMSLAYTFPQRVTILESFRVLDILPSIAYVRPIAGSLPSLFMST